MHEPLVSCLCLTRNRPHLLRRSIQCFLDQTYTNTELVLIAPGSDKDTHDTIRSFKDNRIKTFIYNGDAEISIGLLRNMSIENCTGEYFCQWDDDDWYHSKRVEIQMQTMIAARKEGSVLAYHILYDETTNIAFTSFPCPWPQTILCKKELFNKYKYPDLPRLEDAAFLTQLLSGNHMAPVGWPSLYVYVHHRKNISPGAHFSDLMEKSIRLPDISSEMITEILQCKHSSKTASMMMDSKDILGQINYFSGSY